MKKYEPRNALVGGKVGHETIYQLLDQVVGIGCSGSLFLELSPAVYPAIKKYCATNAKLLDLRKFTDINGNIRFVTLNF